jgi:hypothetical protein
VPIYQINVTSLDVRIEFLCRNVESCARGLESEGVVLPEKLRTLIHNVFMVAEDLEIHLTMSNIRYCIQIETLLTY